MNRALREFRIRGVATNLAFLENVHQPPGLPRRELHHPLHRRGRRALFEAVKRAPGDQAPHLHRRRDGERPSRYPRPAAAADRRARRAAAGLRPAVAFGPSSASIRTGPTPSPAGCGTSSACSSPTPRSATPTSRCWPPAMRSYDLVAAAEAYSRALPGLLSLECWGGATFDVSMRFLTEDPWEAACRDPERRRPISFSRCAARLECGRLRQLPGQCVASSCSRRRSRASTSSGCSTASTGSEHARLDRRGARGGQTCEGAFCTPATSSTRTAPSTASSTMSAS